MPQIILFIKNNEDIIHKNSDISCYILSDSLPLSKFQEAIATGKMVLTIGDKALEKCKEINLYGIVKEIDVSKPVKVQLKHLREALKKKTLGVIIPARRHEAMLAGEVEPDFIAFYSDNPNKDDEIILWYNDLFLIPVAWVANDDNNQTNTPNTDFIIIDTKKFENFGC